MKTCGVCKKEYNLDNFYKDKTKKDGLSWRCKNCDTKRSLIYRQNSDVPRLCAKKWRQNNPHKKIEYTKQLYNKVKVFQKTYQERNPCKCGVSDLECLDYHHVDQKTLEKRVPSIHTFKKAIKEMSKCIVVCANCHRKIHAGTLTTKQKPPTEKELYKLLFELFPNFRQLS